MTVCGIAGCTALLFTAFKSKEIDMVESLKSTE